MSDEIPKRRGRPKKSQIVEREQKDKDEDIKVDPMLVLNKKFDQLVDIVTDLATKIANQTENIGIPKQAVTTNTGEERITDLSRMYPASWRQTVDKILGNKFDFRVEDTANGDFMAYIIVPPEYDRRPAKDDQIVKQDISTGRMRRSSPEADLAMWCEKVKNTVKQLYPDFQI